jgi:hypothetical protein
LAWDSFGAGFRLYLAELGAADDCRAAAGQIVLCAEGATAARGFGSLRPARGESCYLSAVRGDGDRVGRVPRRGMRGALRAELRILNDLHVK